MTIPLIGEVDGDLQRKLIEGLEEAARDNDSHAYEIRFVLNSEGGSVVDAFAIYDLLKSLTIPYSIVVNGACYSAAIIVFLAASVGARGATPNSSFLIHYGTEKVGGMAGRVWFSKLLDTTKRLILSETTITARQFTRWSYMDKYFTYEQARAVGLVS